MCDWDRLELGEGINGLGLWGGVGVQGRSCMAASNETSPEVRTCASPLESKATKGPRSALDICAQAAAEKQSTRRAAQAIS